MDAGATRIEITLKEQGKDGIDVIDNGSGITKENLNKIAEKGATSKLRDFNDITSLRTFGFRGEALNALSVLCTLSITTRVESEEVGVKYTFGSDKGSATSGTPLSSPNIIYQSRSAILIIENPRALTNTTQRFSIYSLRIHDLIKCIEKPPMQRIKFE